MRRLVLFVLALLPLLPTPRPAPAAGDTPATHAVTPRAEVVLVVENMTCPSCPYIVERALTAVEGVVAAEVDFASRTARVVYDPAVTDIEDLTAATAGYGYPSRPLAGDGAS